jgi:very-short-patch-repair endonuclease
MTALASRRRYERFFAWANSATFSRLATGLRRDAHELRRASSKGAAVSPGAIRCPATSAGARHSSCARGASSASREKEPFVSKKEITLAAYAHCHRQAPTDSEARLWSALRSSAQGARFRRQVRLLGFIVDFLAPSHRLVVEVDGGYHAGRKHADARRDHKLQRAGYRVLRIQAERVMRDLPGAVAQVVAALRSRDE